MDRELLIEKLNKVNNPYKEKQVLYEIMDELGIQYKRTNCKSCIFDYYNIIQEELGLIDDASEFSEFNNEYDLVYIYPRPVKWNDYIISKSSPRRILEAFYKVKPQFFIRQIKMNI